MAKLVPQAPTESGLTQQKTPVNSQEFFVENQWRGRQNKYL